LAGVELSGFDGFCAGFSDEAGLSGEAGLSDGLVVEVLSESFEAEESEDLSVSLDRLSFL
jgi:hypothetical protein